MILRTLVTIAATLAPMANAVAATPTPPQSPPESGSAPQGSPRPTDAKDLIGRQVIDRGGENVGDVTAVLRDPSGELKQLVVRTGGKHILLPMNAVTRQGDILRAAQPAADIVKLPSAGPPYDTNQPQ